MKCWHFRSIEILNFRFIILRIFAILCHFWELAKVYEIRVKVKMMIFSVI